MYAHHLRRWSTLSQHQFNILCLPNNTYLSLFTDQARLDQVETMLREACMLKGQWHTNINPLLAACMDDPHRPLLVFAHTDQGNLKRFLQRCKISDVASSQVRRTCDQIVPLDMKCCICHFTKWQIHPSISKGVECLFKRKSHCCKA